jgi:hypothetical protein
MSAQFRSAFLGLASEFRHASNQHNAIELATRLCSMLADFAGSLINVQSSIDGLESGLEDIELEISEIRSRIDPHQQPIEYTFESILDADFGLTVSEGLPVWFQEIDQGSWVSGLFLTGIPNSQFSVVRYNDQETLIESNRLFTREEPLTFPNS